MKYRDLREEVCEANREISHAGLAILTWGNASGIDRREGIVAIKPSGVPYGRLQPSDIVVLDLGSGAVADGSLRPSSDAPTHLHLYREFESIGGVVHAHSPYATAWAQAHRPIPCLGTTHADHYHGPVPATRELSPEEVREDYEANTGRVITAHFKKENLDPDSVPGVLVACHGPFTWGSSPTTALANAWALEAVARMALYSLRLAPDLTPVPACLLEKHFTRKHGTGAYYGQP